MILKGKFTINQPIKRNTSSLYHISVIRKSDIFKNSLIFDDLNSWVKKAITEDNTDFFSMERLRGIVIRSTGSWYKVLTNDDMVFDCKIKGKFRLEGIQATNPIAIGDIVYFHSEPRLEYALIDEISERKNALVRKSLNLSSQSHIIAANLDYAVLIISIRQPNIKPEFIDRFLVIAEAYDIKSIIVINKVDLLRNEELNKYKFFKDLYTGIGYPVIETSAITGANFDRLKNILDGKISLFAGQSGVGKSTLLNLLNPDLQLKTDTLAKATGKGKHTTSSYQMYKLWKNTFAIDSPGVKEMGLFKFELYEISRFFPDLNKYSAGCRFNTCLHINEPGCKVKEALENGLIHQSRYMNYMNILEDYRNELKNI